MNDFDPRVAELEIIGTANIIAAVFASLVMLYMVLAGYFAQDGSESESVLPLIFTVIGLGSVLAAPILKKLMFRSLLGSGAETAPKALANRYFIATLISFALLEGAALMGLVASIVSGDPIWTYGLGSFALVGMAISWPKKDHVREHLSMRML